MNKPELIAEISKRLSIYGNNRHGNPHEPIDDLVYIILSSQTEEYSYKDSYDRIKGRFGDWNELLEVPLETVMELISLGGIQRKKANWIQSSLRRIKQDFGQLSLVGLYDATDEEVLEYLTSLSGVSSKSARCIMMYTMGRNVFPVDTHVWRICRRLGLAPQIAKPTPRLQLELEQAVPAQLRPSLHMNLLSHGRSVCTVYKPNCAECPLVRLCPSQFREDDTWANWKRARQAPQKQMDGGNQ